MNSFFCSELCCAWAGVKHWHSMASSRYAMFIENLFLFSLFFLPYTLGKAANGGVCGGKSPSPSFCSADIVLNLKRSQKEAKIRPRSEAKHGRKIIIFLYHNLMFPPRSESNFFRHSPSVVFFSTLP